MLGVVCSTCRLYKYEYVVYEVQAICSYLARLMFFARQQASTAPNSCNITYIMIITHWNSVTVIGVGDGGRGASRLFMGVKMTSKWLLNMSIKFYTSPKFGPKILYPPETRKIGGGQLSRKIRAFFGHISCKILEILLIFGGKYCKKKFGHFGNFSYIYFREQKCLAPKFTELLRLWLQLTLSRLSIQLITEILWNALREMFRCSSCVLFMSWICTDIAVWFSYRFQHATISTLKHQKRLITTCAPLYRPSHFRTCSRFRPGKFCLGVIVLTNKTDTQTNTTENNTTLAARVKTLWSGA